MPDTMPTDDRVRIRLMLLGVPVHMLTRRALRRIIAASTGGEPEETATADQLAAKIIALAEEARLKLPSG